MTSVLQEFITSPELNQISSESIPQTTSESQQIYNPSLNSTSSDDADVEITITIQSNEIPDTNISDTSISVIPRGATPSGPNRQNTPAHVAIESSSKSRAHIIRLAVAKLRRMILWSSSFDQENAIVVSKNGKHFVTFRFKNNVF